MPARSTLTISTRNARFQQWQSLLTNRSKRNRAGEFLVQGVRPISQAVDHGWSVRSLIHVAERRLSGWATDLLERVDAERVAMSAPLLAELGDRAGDAAPELVAVVGIRPDLLDRISASPDLLAVAFDRPTSPGNIGTLIRSADAFGAGGVVVTGHAADVYDPRAVRASTGSVFGVPVVRAPSHREVVGWATELRAGGTPVRVVGTDETGSVDLADADLTGPTLLVVGNETSGMSSAWHDACDEVVRIPIGGSASSLNAATAATVVLYEAARQRR